jgi:cytochrome c oxidase subunit III
LPALLETDRRAEQGAWLFLGSLGVFFLSSMILFVIYIAMRLQRLGPEVRAYNLPLGFIFTTLLLIAVSITLHFAVVAARSNQTKAVLRMSLLAGLFAMLFWIVQSLGMYSLVQRSLQVSVPGLSPYGFTFILAFLHALHVVGGMIGLLFVIFGAVREKYDHERYWGLKFCANYWHFLDVVWIVMLLGFSVAIVLIQRASVTPLS